jgi:hypothetical protein
MRKRTEKRAAARNAVKLAKDRVRLAALEDGGSPDRPIWVSSASLVEPAALALGCSACGGPVRLLEHEAKAFGAQLLRVVHASCIDCGHRRSVYVGLRDPRN